MKIALAQINPAVGDIEGNSKKIISLIKSTKVDIVVFPELSIVGYSPQDLLLRHSFIKKNEEALKKITAVTKNMIAIVGFVEKLGEDTYNSAAVIRNEQIMEIHRKVCLPNYRVFDEKRWFKEGSEATTFEIDEKIIGVSICEDIWFPDTTQRQKRKGAQLIINISASPYTKNKIELIESNLNKRWEENKLPIVYVNQVGSQDGIIFPGHSAYFNEGKIIKKCRDFEEDLTVVDVK